MNGPRRVYVIVAVVVLAALAVFLFGGCLHSMKGRITAPGVTVQGPKDGNNVSLASDTAASTLTLPAGSKLTTVKWEPVRWQPATPTSPEVKAQPAREETTVVLAADTVWRRDETKITADTGVIDQTVALRRIQTAENRYLLFASIGAAIAAGLFVYIKYPTPALLCGGASVVFFLAWKLADLPDWFYVVGVGGCIAGVVMWKAHERGEKDEREAASTLVKTSE